MLKWSNLEFTFEVGGSSVVAESAACHVMQLFMQRYLLA